MFWQEQRIGVAALHMKLDLQQWFGLPVCSCGMVLGQLELGSLSGGSRSYPGILGVDCVIEWLGSKSKGRWVLPMGMNPYQKSNSIGA